MKSKDPAPLSNPSSASTSPSTSPSTGNADPAGSNGSPRLLLSVILLLVILGACCFANSLKSPLLNWDDQVYIQDNPYIRSFSWSNLKVLFTRPYFKNYAPIHILSYQLDYHFFRLRPEGYRMVNILLHIFNSIIIFFLILEWYHTFKGALIAAAIFTVHTIHVESVVWLSQRKDVLSAFFFFLSLYAYIQFRKRKERCGLRDTGDTHHWPPTTDHWMPGRAHTGWYGFSLGFFLLALLTKPIAITLPLILVLNEFCFQKEGSAIQWKDKIPFFLLACLSAAATCWAQGAETGIKRYVGHNFFLSLLLTGKILVLYLGKLLVPLGLSNRYVFLVTKPSDLFTPSLGLFWAILLLFLGGLVLLWRKRKKNLAFPGLWFLITLLPMANLVPTSTQMADRYLYLPSLGYCLAVGLLVCAFSQWTALKETGRGGERERDKNRYPLTVNRFSGQRSTVNGSAEGGRGGEEHKGRGQKGKLLRTAAIFLIGGLVIFYGSLTWARNRIWRSDRSLWEDALATDPNNYHAATGLANTYLIEAQKKRNLRQKEPNLKRARQLFQQATRIKPDFAPAHLGMGNILIEEGKVKEAIPLLLQARRENDEQRYSPRIEHNLGIAYLRSASLFGKAPGGNGQIKAAEEAFASAIRQDPRFAPAYLSLGTIYFGYATPQGYRMAEEQYLLAIEASPEDPMGYFYLAIAKERLGDSLAAINHYQKALRLVGEGASSSSVNPADIHLNLAGIYYRLQDYSRAVEHYRQVLRLDPNHAQSEAVRSILLSLGAGD